MHLTFGTGYGCAAFRVLVSSSSTPEPTKRSYTTSSGSRFNIIKQGVALSNRTLSISLQDFAYQQ